MSSERLQAAALLEEGAESLEARARSDLETAIVLALRSFATVFRIASTRPRKRMGQDIPERPKCDAGEPRVADDHDAAVETDCDA